MMSVKMVKFIGRYAKLMLIPLSLLFLTVFPSGSIVAESTEPSLTILNPVSHPKTGDTWVIEFTTEGKADLLIIPDDPATREDVMFTGLYCGGESEVDLVSLTGQIRIARDYSCGEVSNVRFLVNNAGDHSVTLWYGDEEETAQNSGVFEWSERLGGTNYDIGNSVAVDTAGNIVVTGYVGGAADLNGDGDTADANEGSGYGGNLDIFVSVFNSVGAFQWSERLGGTGGGTGNSVAVDTAGNIVVTGSVYGAADLNGDGDTADANEGSGYGNFDIFVSVFNSVGAFQWSERLGGPISDEGSSVAVDTAGNIVVTGYVGGAADLNGDGDTADANEGSGYGGNDIFVLVFNSVGVFQWSERLGGPISDEGNSVAVDTAGNIVVTGYVGGAADLNGDGDTADANEGSGYGYNDIFVLVFNSVGAFQWSERLGGTYYDEGSSVAVDTAGNIVVTGYVYGDADLNGDGDTADANEGSYGGNDIFVSVFNSVGVFEWSERLGGTNYDIGNSVAVDTAGNIVVTGYVGGAADLNGDGDTADANERSDYGQYDIFVSVFSPDTVPPVPNLFFPASGSTIGDSSLVITFSMDENGDCRASIEARSYDEMSGDTDCTGDGTLSQTCTMPDLGVSGEKPIYISCKDIVGNKDTGETNEDLIYILDTTLPPIKYNIYPVSGSAILDFVFTITFTTDEEASCHLSLTDESYDQMSDDVVCDGGGSTEQSCTSPDLGLSGEKQVYISCAGGNGNKDTVETNTELEYEYFESTPPQYLGGWFGGDGSSIAVGEDGRVYVSNAMNDGTLQVYDAEGNLLDTWFGFGTGSYMKIAVEGNYVYVADVDYIVVLDTDGNYITDWNADGYVYDIAVDSSGYVYVLYDSDMSSEGIVVFDSEGNYVSGWETYCMNGGIGVDGFGNVYVSCMGGEPAVQKYRSDGTFLTSWGSIGGGEGQFAWPAGIATDNAGTVYISDSANQRIQKYLSDGTFVTMWGEWGYNPGQLNFPNDVSIGPDGRIYAYGNSDGTGVVQVFGKSPMIVGGYSSADREVSPSDPGFLDEYGMSFVEDGQYWTTALSDEDGGYDSQVFKVALEVGCGQTFDVEWFGHGDEPADKLVYISMWNFETSAWEELWSQHCEEDCRLSGSFAGSAYQDGTGFVWVWARADNDYPSGPEIANVYSGSDVCSTYICPGQGMYWETDIPSTTQLVIDSGSHAEGSWEDYALRSVLVQDLTEEHYVFPTLSTGTWYFRVRSCDEDNNCSMSEEYSMFFDHNWGWNFSCPFLFTFDGVGYDFVNDLATSGMLSAGLYLDQWKETPFYYSPLFLPYPEFYVKIPKGSLVSRTVGGETYYDIKTTTELNEVNYYDAAALQVVDHSPAVEVYPDYLQNGGLHTVSDTAPAPVWVRYGEQDVLSDVAAEDGEFFTSDELPTESYLDIKLVNNVETPNNLKVVIKRGKEGTQKVVGMDRLQIKNGEGVFADVPAEYDIFTMEKNGSDVRYRNLPNIYGVDTRVVDLSGLAIPDNEIRLVLGANRQWDIDWIAVDTSVDEEVQVTEVLPYSANLHGRGVSELVPVSPTNQDMKLANANYSQLQSNSGGGNELTGYATRFGEVKDLLSAVDDEFVVMVQGDELELKYSVPEQVEGTERSFVYFTWDYHKPYPRALGDTIDPLPFNAMSQYPYNTSVENYPYAEHQSYIDEYNTRGINWEAPGTQIEENVPGVASEIATVHHSINTDFLTMACSDTVPPVGAFTDLPTEPFEGCMPVFHGTATEDFGVVDSVGFRVDGGVWVACTADDGVFDEQVEAFTCSISACLTSGEHTLDIRTTDSNGNTGMVLAGMTFDILDELADTGGDLVGMYAVVATVFGAMLVLRRKKSFKTPVF